VKKTVLITGATDGIGLLAARMLARKGHRVLAHGRSDAKLAAAAREIGGSVETFRADLARLDEVRTLASSVARRVARLDALVNNAGVLKTPEPLTPDRLDARFAVNALAPYVLARKLLPIIPETGRVVNVASAAQAPVDIRALRGERRLPDMESYAQSKLALVMWTRSLAARHPEGPVFVAVNPGSLLATKMVREGFGIAGKDQRIGAEILCRAVLSDEFAAASGAYFDNDSGRFASPHPDAMDPEKVSAVVEALDSLAGP